MFFSVHEINSTAVEAAVKADYKALLQIFVTNPSAMFEKNIALDIDGKALNKSVLEYFTYARDIVGITLCWQIFQKFLSKDETYQEIFLHQVSATDDYFDLTPLLSSYKHYFIEHQELIDVCNKHTKPFTKMYKINPEKLAALSNEHNEIKIKLLEVKQAWLAIGHSQLVACPRHILRGMGIDAGQSYTLMSSEDSLSEQSKEHIESFKKYYLREKRFFKKFQFLLMEKDTYYGDMFIFRIPSEDECSILTSKTEVIDERFLYKSFSLMLDFLGVSHTLACGNSRGGAHLINQPLGMEHMVFFKAEQDYNQIAGTVTKFQADITAFLENTFPKVITSYDM